MIGSTFLDVGGASSLDPHLWVVCTRPNGDTEVVTVSITSAKEGIGQDRSCVLNVGDHPFIKHESLAYYAKATVTAVRDIEIHVSHGRFKPREGCTEALIDKLRTGALDSMHTPRFVKAAIRDCSWWPAGNPYGC